MPQHPVSHNVEVSGHMSQNTVPHNVEVSGHAIASVLAAMEFTRSRAMKILAEQGIPVFQPEDWYPLQNTVNAYHALGEKIGLNTLKEAGRRIPATAKFPPTIDSVESALRSLEVAYQMNHRGQVGDNIGHYRFEPRSERSGSMVCDNPYPCDFDQGIIEALCERFRPPGPVWPRVEHDPKSCRKSGEASCTYLVQW